MSFQKEDTNICLLGMKGFKGGTTTTQNAQERKEKRQLILATSLCVLFMVIIVG